MLLRSLDVQTTGACARHAKPREGNRITTLCHENTLQYAASRTIASWHGLNYMHLKIMQQELANPLLPYPLSCRQCNLLFLGWSPEKSRLWSLTVPCSDASCKNFYLQLTALNARCATSTLQARPKATGRPSAEGKDNDRLVVAFFD